MIKVIIPHQLCTLAGEGPEIDLEVSGPVTLKAVLDALEERFPVLKGTIRDHKTKARRPFLRFFVCEMDWTHQPPETLLPDAIVKGAEPFLVIGAIAGG